MTFDGRTATTAVIKIGRRILGRASTIRVAGLVWTLIGAFLAYKGYAA